MSSYAFLASQSLYFFLDFCVDHLSQHPDNRETGYSYALAPSLTRQKKFAYHLSPASISHHYNKHLETTYFPWNYHLDPSHCQYIQ